MLDSQSWGAASAVPVRKPTNRHPRRQHQATHRVRLASVQTAIAIAIMGTAKQVRRRHRQPSPLNWPGIPKRFGVNVIVLSIVLVQPAKASSLSRFVYVNELSKTRNVVPVGSRTGEGANRFSFDSLSVNLLGYSSGIAGCRNRIRDSDGVNGLGSVQRATCRAISLVDDVANAGST